MVLDGDAIKGNINSSGEGHSKSDFMRSVMLC